ncbi:dihydroorotase, multifunctional complex type [Aurantimonas manganoxydans SI85-9A1]|uniref:Dihydroorotase, multifunctional complex type n=1 Tax=Aurantimonas manganoxydans (strain ATCC BAA-1229 / DSM 21871 / SI85-9A1) TaxID=287752 RepID=Q1YNI4_AURMS|nr:dihydroorotase [Aurantimonas manganoxydans]EAS51047.1 dihydroorotase, multifunctional complex type [Aurantimonas manganoxydans SI85-9A1]
MSVAAPTVIEHVRIIDPARSLDAVGTVVVVDGHIVAAGADALNQGAPEGAEIIDGRGLLLVPGLVDARVFIGEPGGEHRETIASASAAAAAGGVTSILTMPDTNPVVDEVAIAEFVMRTARDTAVVNVFPAAALTRGLKGKEMSEIGLLAGAGVRAFTDGRHTIADPVLLRRIMTYARDFDALVMHETQDAALTGNGVMNEGLLASWLGLPGAPAEAEIIPLERDLRLAALTGCRYHAAKLSLGESADVMRRAKRRGTAATAGVSINHLSLNENDIGEYRTFFRLSPPLRREEDRAAMVEALADGTIDIIVSSHDPQDADGKRRPFAEAESGAIGLETLLPAALRLHHSGAVPLARIIEAVTAAPAKLLGLDRGTLASGSVADMALVDLEAPFLFSEDRIRSRSKNTAFENARFQGQVLRTFVAGRTVFSESDRSGG